MGLIGNDVKCREVDGNNCWGNTICVRNWITAIRIEGNLYLYDHNTFKTNNRSTFKYGKNIEGSDILWNTGAYFFDNLYLSNYNPKVSFPEKTPSLTIWGTAEFKDIPVLHYGNIKIGYDTTTGSTDSTANVTFGMGLGTENNNKDLTVTVTGYSKVKTAALVFDGGYQFFVQNNSSTALRRKNNLGLLQK